MFFELYLHIMLHLLLNQLKIKKLKKQTQGGALRSSVSTRPTEGAGLSGITLKGVDSLFTSFQIRGKKEKEYSFFFFFFF